MFISTLSDILKKDCITSILTNYIGYKNINLGLAVQIRSINNIFNKQTLHVCEIIVTEIVKLKMLEKKSSVIRTWVKPAS